MKIWNNYKILIMVYLFILVHLLIKNIHFYIIYSIIQIIDIIYMVYFMIKLKMMFDIQNFN